jgi:hypothetical protein
MFSSAARTFKVTFPTLAPDPVHIDSDTCIGSNVCQSDLMERVTGHYLQLVTSLVETVKQMVSSKHILCNLRDKGVNKWGYINDDDLQRDEYIPFDQKLMLTCKQRDKWIASEENELGSLIAKALLLKWYTLSRKISTVSLYSTGLLLNRWYRLYGDIQSCS